MNNSDCTIAAKTTATQTVLLVDDDAKLLRGLKRSLANEGYCLLTAVSPSEALAILSKEKVDVVLSDNLMAGALGTEFVESVRQKYPRIKLLMLSGYMPPAAAQRAIDESKVLQVLTKPCDAREVAAAIRDALVKSADDELWNRAIDTCEDSVESADELASRTIQDG